MHEMAIALALVEQLQRVAAEQRAVRIVRVELECGVMQQVVPEALRLAFAACSADTCAAGAELVVREEPLAAVCRACGQRYRPALDDYTCPGCRSAEAELVAGRDILLRAVECETQSGGATS